GRLLLRTIVTSMKILVAPILSLLLAVSAAFCDITVLSPFAGPNSGTPAPFFITTNMGPSVRYQQVYAGSDFQRYGDFQYLITGVSFTAGSIFGPHDVTIPNLQI